MLQERYTQRDPPTSIAALIIRLPFRKAGAISKSHDTSAAKEVGNGYINVHRIIGR